MSIRPLLSRAVIGERTWSLLLDFAVFAALLAMIEGLAVITRYWFGAITPAAEISRSPRALPLYAFYSVVRIAIAYVLSLWFALGYGYIAAYNRRLETIMVAVLDILQSIPVLSFLPGVMLAMVALFPTRQLGVEFGAILLIFTGQVWNMAFSFYASLKSIPRELREAARIYGFGAWQRFVQLELPYGAIGLVWNSMVSVAGGWFFLMACEMFVLGNRDFRLPGLGSYLQTAASAGDTGAILWGLGAMIGVILLIDQLVWRPAIAWSDKFKFEQVESSAQPSSAVLNLLRRSNVLERFRLSVMAPLSERVSLYLARRGVVGETAPPAESRSRMVLGMLVGAVIAGSILYALAAAAVSLKTITIPALISTLEGAGATFARVLASLVIAAVWTIPAGVAIGFNPRLARFAQPFAQLAASVPATALFPVLLLALIRIGGGLGAGSILLMLLGTQWYVLFNVIAGAMAIPSDLKEVADVFHFSQWDRWRIVILPGIFPYLVTGMVTASGGAWNASIVAEYFHFRGHTLSTVGLGAQISQATDSGNFHLLLLSTIVMATLVVTVNRSLWRPLYRVAQTRFKLEG
ncbi:MAG TPA: ABC transporter permease subunit [Bryobacteraceae bacterium]|nr:ABC transporter permease subunit [Bryobacteraceae bacterium]